MECPYCGSKELAYDFSCGYIICTFCGTTLDTIFIEFYESSTSYQINEYQIGSLSVRKGIEKKKLCSKKMMFTKIGMDIVVYEKYARRARKNVYIDLDTVLKKEQGVSTSARVYHHKDEEKVVRIANEDPVVKRIVENVIDRDPILSSRTPRGKIALALIIKSILEGGNIDLNELSKKTSMSVVHMKRLLNLVKNRIPYLRQHVPEISKIISVNR